MPGISPQLSIVTISYNDPNGLATTLYSLEPLRKGPLLWEHVIVDQSPDLNETIFQSLAADWPLHRVQSPPLGIYGAHNRGLAMARGKILWFLNGGDSLSDAEALLAALSLLENSARASILIAPVQVSRDGKALYLRAPKAKLWQNLLGENRLCHQAMLYRREVFQRLGNYDESYRVAADYEHHFRAWLAGEVFVRAPRPFADFDLGGASSNIQRSFEEFSRVQEHFSARLPLCLRILNRFCFSWNYAKTMALKRISGSRFGEQLRPFWWAWNRWFNRL